MLSIEVEPLALPDATGLVQRLFTDNSLAAATPDVFEETARTLDCIPFYIHHVVSALLKNPASLQQPVTMQAVNAVIDHGVHSSDNPWDLQHCEERTQAYHGQQRAECLALLDAVERGDETLASFIATPEASVPYQSRAPSCRGKRAIEQGRESYYELCEPLMRLCMEVKKQRGEPVSLFVDFLRIWYTQPELKTMLRDPDVIHRLGLRYLERALLLAQETSTDPKHIATYKELTQASANAQTQDVISLIKELAAVGADANASWLRFGIALIRSLKKNNVPITEEVAQAWTHAVVNLVQTYIDNPNNKSLLALASEERKLFELAASAAQSVIDGAPRLN